MHTTRWPLRASSSSANSLSVRIFAASPNNLLCIASHTTFQVSTISPRGMNINHLPSYPVSFSLLCIGCMCSLNVHIQGAFISSCFWYCSFVVIYSLAWPDKLSLAYPSSSYSCWTCISASTSRFAPSFKGTYSMVCETHSRNSSRSSCVNSSFCSFIMRPSFLVLVLVQSGLSHGGYAPV